MGAPGAHEGSLRQLGHLVSMMEPGDTLGALSTLRGILACDPAWMRIAAQKLELVVHANSASVWVCGEGVQFDVVTIASSRKRTRCEMGGGSQMRVGRETVVDGTLGWGERAGCRGGFAWHAHLFDEHGFV